MKKSAIILILLAQFFGCSQKKEGESFQSDLIDTAQVFVEKDGEFDPIAAKQAVKGGSFTTWGGSFPKSLNYFLDANSFSGQITGLIFESLLSLHSTRNEYIGILSNSWAISKDKKTFTFKIHPSAKWSDDRPITAEDVQFYYDVIMNPKNMTSIFRVSLKRFARPEVLDERTIRITAKEPHWKNFLDAGGFMAFPKHMWENKDFNKINFDFPVVSGPYELSEVKKNRYIKLKRRTDWWGRIKKYNQFKFNFDYVKFKFMEDRNKALEAFKKGDFDAYAIYTSSIWAKKTHFDQVKKGWVVRQKVFNREPRGFQGFAINLRRPIFQDVLVRKALCHMLNRELMNEKLMFNEYFMLNCYYPDLYPNNVNPDVPIRKYDPERARDLLKKAGWEPGQGGILAKDGKKFEISFLTYSVDMRHTNIYVEDLKKVGISANIEQLSMSSVRKRLDQHNFDLFWINWGAGRLKDPEPMWHSSTADQIATNNMSGVKDAYIDSLIEVQKTELSIDRRIDILEKIDRRLTEIVPYIFLWQAGSNRILYWNRFGTPPYVFDKFNREDAIIPYWWFDAEKNKILATARKKNRSLPILPERIDYQD